MASFTHDDLYQFTGTSGYYRHPFTGMRYTDGIHFVAENAGGGAYWLLDIISTVGMLPMFRKMWFQAWKLVVKTDKTAVITMREDKDTPILFERKLEYTDFPSGDWSFWLIDGVLILPSEY